MAELPPYPRRKSNTTTIVFIILGICAVCCILGVLGVVGAGFFAINKSKNFIACTVGFAEATEAMRDYVKDHDGKLPPAAKWQDEIRPYFKKRQEKDEQGTKFFGSFDADKEWVCKDDNGGQGTGIAFNSDLSGLNIDDIKNKSTSIVLFEVPKTGMNLNEPYVELEKSASPRAFGQPRGWFSVNANFDIQGPNNGRNIQVKTDD